MVSSPPHPKRVSNQPVVLIASAMSQTLCFHILRVPPVISSFKTILKIWTQKLSTPVTFEGIPLVPSAVGLFLSTDLTLSLMKTNHKQYSRGHHLIFNYFSFIFLQNKFNNISVSFFYRYNVSV